jgi:hypothetical protein
MSEPTTPPPASHALGAALRAFILAQGGARLKSYNRVGWRAQYRQLSRTARGRQGLAAAGVQATARTAAGWLRGKQASKRNREAIAAAYAAISGQFPAGVKTAPNGGGAILLISGVVDIGGDRRTRGTPPNVAFKIGAQQGGDWTRIEEAWNAGEVTDEELEDYFIEDVVAVDIDDLSEDLSFPGSSYTISFG